jgi:hypothetical protein
LHLSLTKKRKKSSDVVSRRPFHYAGVHHDDRDSAQNGAQIPDGQIRMDKTAHHCQKKIIAA